MAGIKTINKEQESRLQRKFNLQVDENYSGSEDEDLTATDLATQLEAARETTKKFQKLTAQLQKQIKHKPATTSKNKKAAPDLRRSGRFRERPQQRSH